MKRVLDSVVVGAGPAGLAASAALTDRGIEHEVLERGRVGESWRTQRWDSFRLNTPGWMNQMLGGQARSAYAPAGEVVQRLERLAADCPIQAGVGVTRLAPAGDGYALRTANGELRARTVVVATGAENVPRIPALARAFPDRVGQHHAADYRRPGFLPNGAVLVVGSGQSGCQIAEELHQAGREVFLACGRAPWFPRRLGDRDLSWWVLETGFLDAPFSALPSPAARLAANVQATGAGGGHDLHYRTLLKLGVTLLGHFLGADGRRARFAPDLGESVAWGDERNAQLMELVRKLVVERGLPSPEIPEPEPFSGEAPEELDLHGFGAVVFAGGFRPDYESWVSLPGAFDELGFPIHEEGASTVAPGLYFVGVHFLRKRKSALLNGVGEDAAIVARQITRRQVSAT
jgi:putative flavoprotein involved in K+ transport